MNNISLIIFVILICCVFVTESQRRVGRWRKVRYGKRPSSSFCRILTYQFLLQYKVVDTRCRTRYGYKNNGICRRIGYILHCKLLRLERAGCMKFNFNSGYNSGSESDESSDEDVTTTTNAYTSTTTLPTTTEVATTSTTNAYTSTTTVPTTTEVATTSITTLSVTTPTTMETTTTSGNEFEELCVTMSGECVPVSEMPTCDSSGFCDSAMTVVCCVGL